MNIITTHKSPNKSKRSGDRIDMIVIHATAGKMPGTLSWLINPNAKVSAHYLITKSGEVYELVEPKDKAWHAGKSKWQGESNCNDYSIGIELENSNKGDDPYPQEQVDVCYDLCLALINRYNIPLSRVVTHWMISPGRKTDPKGFPFDGFIDRLNNKMNEVENDTDEIKPSKNCWSKITSIFKKKEKGEKKNKAE